MSTPAASILIPTFNGSDYIEECLKSVLRQTFDQAEVVIVDDCSRDDTFEIACAYASRDARVRVFRNTHNLGLVGNWNRCIDLANGEWLKFVFQDDVIAPNCVERLFARADAQTSFIFSSREFIFCPETSDEIVDEYKAGRNHIESIWRDLPDISPRAFGQAVLGRIGGNLVGEPTVVMLRRSVFEQFGRFNPNLIVSCDLEYWSRVGVHTGMAYVPERLASFRVHDNATTAKSRTSRSYRMNVLDDLVLIHEYAFNPIYEPLRALAREQHPPIDLGRLFREKALWAKNIARSNLKRGNRAVFNEWQDVSRLYPRMQMDKQLNVFSRALGRALGARQGRPDEYGDGTK